ncbi:pilin N-terminal domain-containing protein [Enterococcus sp. DIV0876]|uniref:pilin N-terminal domain-containing protein n=1 Tax=Enterococcus sp. DIV0876 TaxID=2774633 RepID=UPI003D2FD278
MKKILMVVLSVVMGVLLNSNWMPIAHAEDNGENEETVEFILHKLQGTNNSELVQNTGKELDAELFYGEEGEMIPLAGVTFTAFDLSDLFYELRSDTDTYPTAESVIEYLNDQQFTVNELGQLVNSGNHVFKETSVDEGTTTDSGQVIFDLPATHGKNQGKIYVFVETAAPAEVTTKAQALIVGLPVLDENGQPLETIHLYPKNFLSYGALEGNKVVQVITDGEVSHTPLANAEFYIHQAGTDFVLGETLVLSKLENGVRTWVAQNAENAEIFTTNEAGKLNITDLAQGDYLLSEISTSFDGNTTALNNSVVNVPFRISANVTTELPSDLINDDLNVEKTNTGSSYQYGDLVDYTVVAAIPSGIADEDRYTKFIITDEHHADLLLVESSLTIEADGQKIPNDAYTLISSGHTFTIEFKNPAHSLGDYANQLLTINYQMMVTTSAIPDTNMNNTVTVTTDWDEETDTGEDVFTGGRRFVKIDGHSKATLSGAVFYITNQDGAYLVETTDGYDWSTDSSSENMVQLTSDEEGIFEIKGLAYGTYYLYETSVSSEEYILPTEGFEFEVTKHSYQTTEALAADSQEIENYTKGFLPATGGMGIILFLLLGSLTMGGTVYWLKKA